MRRLAAKAFGIDWQDLDSSWSIQIIEMEPIHFCVFLQPFAYQLNKLDLKSFFMYSCCFLSLPHQFLVSQFYSIALLDVFSLQHNMKFIPPMHVLYSRSFVHVFSQIQHSVMCGTDSWKLLIEGTKSKQGERRAER